MRLRHLIYGDIKFQARHGFYLLYFFLTMLYVVLLFSLPKSWKANAASILIFSDPSAIGLFFMGAITLLEKSQRVSVALSISPLRAWEYIVSKVVSLSLIALLVATVLALSADCTSLPGVLLGTALSSALFTLIGITISTKISSINQFIFATVPFELIAFLPAILHLADKLPACLQIYPPNVCMDLIAGRSFSIIGLIFTIILVLLLFLLAQHSVLKMWRDERQVKL